MFAEPAPAGSEAGHEDEDEVEVEPDELEVEPDELFAVEHRPHKVRSEPNRDSRIGRGARLPDHAPRRSPLAVMACLAFGGYLLWLAFQSYQDLGRLHARSALAAPSQLTALRGEHGRVTLAVIVNTVTGASFLVGALLFLTGKRGSGLVFVLGGIAATIYLLCLSSAEGPALRQDELLMKLGGIALCAWFRPRASDGGTSARP